MKPTLLVVFALLCTAIFSLTSCAYHASAIDRSVPGGYRSVAIPVFQNKTQETGVEVYFTNAIIREFERGKIGEITDRSNAQVTLEGVIDSISYQSTNQIQNDDNQGKFLPLGTVLNTEYRILLHTTLRLRRNSDQTIVWEGGFDGERSYLAPKIGQAGINTANALYNHSARYQNIQSLATDLMAEAHDRLTENF